MPEDFQTFFSEFGHAHVVLHRCGGVTDEVSVEQLFCFFRDRVFSELGAA